jgi:hypothetical protein
MLSRPIHEITVLIICTKEKGSDVSESPRIFSASVLPVSKGISLISTDIAAHVPASARISISTKIARSKN